MGLAVRRGPDQEIGAPLAFGSEADRAQQLAQRQRQNGEGRQGLDQGEAATLY